MLKKVLLVIGILFGMVVLGSGFYVYKIYFSVKETANKMYEPIDVGKVSKTTEKLAKPTSTNSNTKAQQPSKPTYTRKPPALKGNNPRPLSILLMGVDERPGDVGRSDTLIVLTLNPKTNTMQMVSIPRDTRTEISGRGSVDKINAAYAYGGTGMEVNTVENSFKIPIDYYIRINMEGLSDLVNAVGGVTVYNDLSWQGYPKGTLKLNGSRALGYVRMRHQDPRGDFGRNMRQREVIQAVVDQAAHFSSFTHYQTILNAISKNVRTNLTFNDMKYIAMHYKNTRENVSTYEVKGKGTMINHIYYLLVNSSERAKVQAMVNKQLR